MDQPGETIQAIEIVCSVFPGNSGIDVLCMVYLNDMRKSQP